MRKKDNYTEVVIKDSYKELIYKIIASIFVRGLLLVIPIFWSMTINNLSEGDITNAYYLLVVSVILAIFYYIWLYLNQVTWFRFYDKLYVGYTNLITKSNTENIKKISLGEYTNVINNDIDILCNFLGNAVVRVIQMLEFLIIYVYFLSLNIYIFLVTVVISVIMVIIILISGRQVKNENVKRKSTLDRKTVVANEMYDSIKEENYNATIFKKFHQSTMEYLKANHGFNLLSQAFIYTVLAAIEICKYAIIFYCVYLISIGEMEVGTILLIYTYYDKIITNFEVVGTISTEYQSFVVSLKRLNKLGNDQKL